ncbi:glycosyltransferase family 4 protein [Chitinophaga sp. G-6-1-13]|uniref:Glycosyltransferase family 4 protein n=1 Tax=Chitinophaga fulva TaxID=2728842 RepID=A0A848GS54_9BACT|nr:glycosyltransferase [Chitinophaga fulva]NML38648.1 glycosyltransferase family 4 protein [Chitinophaga fulva]
MNILITNIELNRRSGTVVYVYELASALNANGYNVEVYTHVAGETAQELIRQGINVVTKLNQLKFVPDIVHAHHNLTTIDVLRRFKDIPIVYFLHDRTSFYDIPIRHSRILKYIAVDYNCLDRLHIEGRIPEEYTAVIYNWVNVDRFRLRSEFAEKPSRALVFSNYAKKNNHYKVIAEACASYGLQLDVIGEGTGSAVKNPEDFLAQYDLVFAKAKAAIEALSTGAAVVLCDFRGLGEMVNPENRSYLRKFNFGMKTLTRPFDAALMIAEIDKYNALHNQGNAIWIREKSSFTRVLAEITQLYEQTIRNYEKGERGIRDNRLHTLWVRCFVKTRISLPVRAILKLVRITKEMLQR